MKLAWPDPSNLLINPYKRGYLGSLIMFVNSDSHWKTMAQTSIWTTSSLAQQLAQKFNQVCLSVNAAMNTLGSECFQLNSLQTHALEVRRSVSEQACHWGGAQAWPAITKMKVHREGHAYLKLSWHGRFLPLATADIFTCSHTPTKTSRSLSCPNCALTLDPCFVCDLVSKCTWPKNESTQSSLGTMPSADTNKSHEWTCQSVQIIHTDLPWVLRGMFFQPLKRI